MWHGFQVPHSNLPVIITDPSTGHKQRSSLVSVLLNIAGVDANLHSQQEQIIHKGEQYLKGKEKLQEERRVVEMERGQKIKVCIICKSLDPSYTINDRP